jgi:hypothetical protein
VLEEKPSRSSAPSGDKSMDDSNTTDKTSRSFATGISHISSIQMRDDTVYDTSGVSVGVDTGSIVVGSVEKATIDTKVGISLKKDKNTDSILIVSISETKLKVGQKVLSINGLRCPKNAADAVRVIATTIGTLAIEAADLVKPDDAVSVDNLSDDLSVYREQDPTHNVHPSVVVVPEYVSAEPPGLHQNDSETEITNGQDLLLESKENLHESTAVKTAAWNKELWITKLESTNDFLIEKYKMLWNSVGGLTVFALGEKYDTHLNPHSVCGLTVFAVGAAVVTAGVVKAVSRR